MPGTRITTEDELREIMGEPSGLAVDKVTDHIDEESARVLRASPFFLLATASPDGDCDVSPRGDPPGSVLVLDDHTLAFGDRKGNRRLDSFQNILTQPKVALLFLVPGMNETIRVNGTATILRDAPYADQLTVKGHRPEIVIEVRVDELYMHCAKAFVRSSLWKAESWPSRRELPTGGQLLRSASGTNGTSVADLDRILDEGTRTRQY
ncbi:MSMEG_1061 family FMN-dependent PPOX-type flavoprotein [Pseudonocardia acaciae]|uniref:MSMEG_1061 family FMN-dependent PPOX-type flavoprotein n=1 Tax=Pseudonocardia acaciae TaxID=551276 RepID=UPI00048EABC2|nr:MSMEG_1061 family FMN-dependent PPOX-type flavoprotein [Pseudonocardia acaciae]